MDIEQLQCVLAIVREKTFLDAAESLHRSQSSVSKSVQKLEEELGIKIFERTTRRVQLTPAGEDVAAHAEKIVADYRGLLHAVDYHRQMDFLDLRIGSIYFGKNNRLLPKVADFMRIHPSMNITIEESTTTPLIHQLENHQLEVIFVSSMYLKNDEKQNFSRDSRYISCSFSVDPYYVIVSKEHPLAQRECLEYKDLEGQRLITTDRTMDVYHTALNYVFREVGIDMPVATQCTNIRSVLHMVSNNIGIAILSKLVVEESDDLVLIPLKNPLIRDTQMVILKQNKNVPHIRAFYQFIKNEVEMNRIPKEEL